MGVNTRTRSRFCKACAVAVILRKSKRVMMPPPELRREGWNVRCMDAAGESVGGRRKNHRNPMVSTTERTVVTRLLVFRFAFMVDITRTFQKVKSRGTTSAIGKRSDGGGTKGRFFCCCMWRLVDRHRHGKARRQRVGLMVVERAKFDADNARAASLCCGKDT